MLVDQQMPTENLSEPSLFEAVDGGRSLSAFLARLLSVKEVGIRLADIPVFCYAGSCSVSRDVSCKSSGFHVSHERNPFVVTDMALFAVHIGIVVPTDRRLDSFILCRIQAKQYGCECNMNLSLSLFICYRSFACPDRQRKADRKTDAVLPA